MKAERPLVKKFQLRRRLSFCFCAISILVMGGGFFYQWIITSFNPSLHIPPGKMVDMGDYKLHLQDMGSGDVTVVLDAGMACFSLDWALVQPEIAKFTRVVSYDRAGYGWSDESPLPRTSHHIVSELHALLKTANIPPPYILVGHSFGGVNARLYTSRYPEEVAGIVLVDSAHEEHFQKMPVWPTRLLERWLMYPPVATFGATIGFVRVLNYFLDVRKMIASLPADVKETYLAHMSTTKYVRTVAQEFYYFADSLQQLRESPKKIEDKPLMVISAGQFLISEDRGYDKAYLEEISRIWRGFQMDLVKRSSKGKQVIAEKSGHMISHQQPDLIVEAVREIVQESRSSFVPAPEKSEFSVQKI